jgi:hypothetical protein
MYPANTVYLSVPALGHHTGSISGLTYPLPQSYMFYQLKWFDPTLPDSVISSQAGILQYVLVFPLACRLFPLWLSWS